MILVVGMLSMPRKSEGFVRKLWIFGFLFESPRVVKVAINSLCQISLGKATDCAGMLE
jgi:hypothetical protein